MFSCSWYFFYVVFSFWMSKTIFTYRYTVAKKIILRSKFLYFEYFTIKKLIQITIIYQNSIYTPNNQNVSLFFALEEEYRKENNLRYGIIANRELLKSASNKNNFSYYTRFHKWQTDRKQQTTSISRSLLPLLSDVNK